MKIAALSDIHGNIWALEAVLDDIRKRGVDGIVNCGDSLYGPLDPSAVAAVLRDSPIVSIRGNEDRILIQSGKNRAYTPSLEFTLGALDAEDRRWLRSLRPTAVYGGDIRLCHGNLRSDEMYLFERVTRAGIQVRSERELAGAVEGLAESLVLCGHSHVIRESRPGNGVRIVNVGSVGLPAFRDDWPFPHALENESPHAHYVLVSGKPRDYVIEAVTVSYDWERASAAAADHNRPDWAGWLRTGRA